MKEETPAASRPSEPRWRPDSWSLRTKITAVLLVPVVVALALAAGLIQPELARASALSGVRDQMSVVLDTAQLTGLIDQEMVAAASAPGSPELSQRIAAVDAKTATLRHDAQFADLPQGTQSGISTALGRLSGLRLASTAAGDNVVSDTAGYRDIVFSLAQTVPEVVSGADRTDLTNSANTIASLMQVRSDVAVQDAMLRSAPANELGTGALISADRAATEESLIGDQVERTVGGSVNNQLTAAMKSTADRQATLESALATGRTEQVPTLIAPLGVETTALDGLITNQVDALSSTVSGQTNQVRSDALRDSALVLAALLGALAVALYVARTLVNPVRRLHADALDAANHRLPQAIARARSGADIGWRDVPAVPVTSTDEIGQLASAFDQMQRQALRLAGEQAELRRQVSEMFMTLSRRSQSLVEQQLSMIEDLESEEQDPQRLDSLFRIDHIATRLRRNGENLQVLAGGSPSRGDHQPVTVVELLRAATSEVKDYKRITLGNAPGGSVRGEAASDVVHMLAELLENATRFSSPEEKVVLTADRGTDGGLLIEVVDTGLGMALEDLEMANARLAAGAAVTPETTRRMGLYVVGRLAALHGVTVRLRKTTSRATSAGITASVHLPGELVLAEGVPGDQRVNRQPAIAAPARQETPAVQAARSAAEELLAAFNGSGAGTASGGSSGTNGNRPPLPHRKPAAGIGINAGRAAINGGDPAATTPIFDTMVSNWFVPPESAPAESHDNNTAVGGARGGAAGPGHTPEQHRVPVDWVSPADETRRAAESAVGSVAATSFTASGLPIRNRGAQLAPGAAAPRRDSEPSHGGGSPDFRDPAVVRSHLCRHYSGMRAARQRTQGIPPGAPQGGGPGGNPAGGQGGNPGSGPAAGRPTGDQSATKAMERRDPRDGSDR